MTHPKPDRSDHRPNRVKSGEYDQVDAGWHEGFLSDGRPYRIEAWGQFQILCVTVFLSSAGIEQLSNEQLADLLEREKVVRFHSGERRFVDARQLTDASGNPMWSINVVIGAYDEPAMADYLPLRPPDGDRAKEADSWSRKDS